MFDHRSQASLADGVLRAWRSRILGSWSCCPEQLDSVAPRVLRVEPSDTRQGLVPIRTLPRLPQALRQRVESAIVCYSKRWVRLLGWREAILDADMQLLPSATKPHPTPRAQLLWLVDLLQAEQSPVEAPRFGLAPSWSGHLHVIQADYADCIAPAHRRFASNTRSETVMA
jgi:hypothetical protein